MKLTASTCMKTLIWRALDEIQDGEPTEAGILVMALSINAGDIEVFSYCDRDAAGEPVADSLHLGLENASGALCLVHWQELGLEPTDVEHILLTGELPDMTDVDEDFLAIVGDDWPVVED